MQIHQSHHRLDTLQDLDREAGGINFLETPERSTFSPGTEGRNLTEAQIAQQNTDDTEAAARIGTPF